MFLSVSCSIHDYNLNALRKTTLAGIHDRATIGGRLQRDHIWLKLNSIVVADVIFLTRCHCPLLVKVNGAPTPRPLHPG